FHSPISGPLSCTAAGALPEMTSERSLARVLAVWPAMAVCSQLPPFSSNISPSLAMAAASEPVAHWCSISVLGSANAVLVSSADATTAAAETAVSLKVISLSPFALLRRPETWRSGYGHLRFCSDSALPRDH